MFRVFGFTGVFVLVVVVVAAGVVVVVVPFGVAVRAGEAAGTVVLFVAGGTAAPDVEVEPVLLPVVVVAGVVAGKVVNGVGTGGNGFDITLAIISVNPASELLWRNL